MPELEDVYADDEEQARLAAILEERYLRMLGAVHELVAAALPDLPIAQFRVDDVATRRMLDEAAEQVVRIDDTTKQAIRERLQDGQRRGLSSWELANGTADGSFKGIEQLFRETWASRAETVARTELQNAQVRAAQDRYAATGKVSQVELREHTDTDPPCVARNGQRVPVTQRVELLHPNCRVGLIPVIEGEG